MKVIRKAGYSARFSVHRPRRIKGLTLPLPNYRQEDYHSCGYLAALTVSEYLLGKDFCPKDLLMAVRPSTTSGTTRHRMMKGLESVGIDSYYTDGLTVLNLLACIRRNIPVIITVWPDWWPGDHWTVVQGFAGSRVYLTNHYSMSMKDFKREWIEAWGSEFKAGAGLICERS